jgi:enoyl-CoA hydratase
LALVPQLQEIRAEVRDGVGVITLDAPQRRNALTADMAHELKRAIEAFSANPEVGCLLVRGEGPAFCAGADRELLRSAGDPDNHAARGGLEDVYASFIALGTSPVPSVAAVQGWAIGAGLNLALAADVRLAAGDAQLLAGFGRLQIHPGGGHLHLLQRLGGAGVAAAIAIFDQPVSGQRAAELGLAWRAVGSEELLDEALALAAGPARVPALARLMTTGLRRGSQREQWEAAIERERGAQLESLARSPVLHPEQPADS